MPQQRWQIFPPQKAQAQQIADATALSPLLAQVLINRGIYTPEQAWEFLDPETLLLPSPLDEFPDLEKSLDLLEKAIARQQKILICGDYDADGMTSTALLMRSLRYLGAKADYAIPSRMDEGYGINLRIVEEFHAAGGAVIITVDNGIAAYAPIARAVELGLTVILTDHHAVPEQVPPATAILNPQLIRETSPYRGVAGVGVAYILAICLAQRLDKMQDLTATLLALFTLGTIADLAPLTGVNRRWVRRGLTLLPKSRIAGIQALIEVADLAEDAALKPEAIGFRLGPRINAVGRIDDPQIVIDLLTTDDVGVALQRAMQCEETNKLRRQLCEVIEAQAVEWCEQQQAEGLLDLHKERVLVVVQPDWHHGVIGIVASRLVERYGVPVFIGTYEDKDKKEIRGSARSIPEFNVVEALRFCDDLLGKYGGHRAAGGFSFPANKLRQVKSRLSTFACKHLQLEHLKPLVKADVQAPLESANLDLFSQIDKIHPCGIENPDPVFWTAGVRVVEQKVIGKTRAHLKLTVAHQAAGENGEVGEPVMKKAIAWRWGEYYPLPKKIDIAYKLRLNEWKGQQTVELELVGVRLASTPAENRWAEDRGIRPWSSEGPVESLEDPFQDRLLEPLLEDPSPDPRLIQPSAPALPQPPGRAQPNPQSGSQSTYSSASMSLGSMSSAAMSSAATSSDALSNATSYQEDAQKSSQKPSQKSDRSTAKARKSPTQVAKEIALGLRQDLQAERRKRRAVDEDLPANVEPSHSSAGSKPTFSIDPKTYWLTRTPTPAETAERTEAIAPEDLEARPKNALAQPLHRGIAIPADPFNGIEVSGTEDALTAALHVEFYYSQRHYTGTLEGADSLRQLTIRNPEGHLLVVQMSDRQGFLCLPMAEPEPVDIGELKYFNLVRAGLSAIELKQKTQLLMKKAALLAEKDRQIATLKAQIELLEEKITQLSADQQQQFASLETERQAQEDAIQGQEAQIQQLQIQVSHMPLLPKEGGKAASDVKQQVRKAVGDSVWFCLQPASQKDLQAAYQNYRLINTGGPDAHIEDYSAAGDRLSAVIEREVLLPFFTGLCDFLSAKNVQTVGGISLSATAAYRLDMLPPLLADKWRTFSADQLSQRSLSANGANIVPAKAARQLSAGDRALLTQFFAQWEHPMVTCLSTKSRQAASSLDQISKLGSIASQPERFLYRWQYDLLHQLIAGKAGKGGLLRQVFAL